MITGINESKTLTKHILCKFDSRKCKSGITINVSASVKKTLSEYKKHYVWNPATCNCENGKYFASTIDDSKIKCNEIIEKTKTVPTNLNEKNATC